MKTELPQVRHQRGDRAVVETATLGDENQVIEHLQDLRARMVDGADDRSALVGQHPQQGHALQAGGAV